MQASNSPAPQGTDTLSYDQAGVNYDLIDPLKIAAQRAAAATGAQLGAHGFSEIAASRGESAYVVDVGPFYLASIVECLGTKWPRSPVAAGTTALRRTPSPWR
jgi:phosphoribosylformylglycinamidine cyclo-ligase